MSGPHTGKQKRQAKHVADSERKRGMSSKRAESVGWATVNKRKAMPSGGYVATPNPIKKPRHAPDSKTAQARYSGKRGEAATARVDARFKKDMVPGAGLPGGDAYPAMGKAFEVLSIDEYHAQMVKADGAPPKAAAPAPVAPAAAPKKFPRRMKPTVRMKPISDEEAMANLKAGKYREKSLRKLMTLKALATGYGKVSGGGALKAPNRPPLTIARAMDAMSAPRSPGPPKVYLPGVHSPKSPVRRPLGIKKPKAAAKSYPTIIASERPTTLSKKSPRALDAGGATELSNSVRNVVHKAEGAAMGKTNFNDLFKSEFGAVAEDVLCDCPHCEKPITKSDLGKARGHKGKGATTHLTGPKEVNRPGGEMVREQNPHGGTMRGGEGKGVHAPSRGVPGAKKHDEATGVQNGKGSRARKAMDGSSDDSSSDDASSDEGSGDDKAPPEKPVKKSMVTIRGTEWVQYIDNPTNDEFIAKSILEGSLGGTPPTQPLDLNNDLTRLFV